MGRLSWPKWRWRVKFLTCKVLPNWRLHFFVEPHLLSFGLWWACSCGIGLLFISYFDWVPEKCLCSANCAIPSPFSRHYNNVHRYMPGAVGFLRTLCLPSWTQTRASEISEEAILWCFRRLIWTLLMPGYWQLCWRTTPLWQRWVRTVSSVLTFVACHHVHAAIKLLHGFLSTWL